eukprot:4274397-Pyramimonas_sp.AAC.1
MLQTHGVGAAFRPGMLCSFDTSLIYHILKKGKVSIDRKEYGSLAEVADPFILSLNTLTHRPPNHPPVPNPWVADPRQG